MTIDLKTVLLTLLIMTGFGCQSTPSQPLRNFETVELQLAQLNAINREIDRFNDNKLANILELRDYSRKISLFCIHQIVKVSKEENPSRFFDVIGHIYCGESSLKEGLKNKSGDYRNLFNLSAIPIRYILTGNEDGKFFMSTYEVPRNPPYYNDDLGKIFTKEELEELDNAKRLSGEEIGNRLRAKIASDRNPQANS